MTATATGLPLSYTGRFSLQESVTVAASAAFVTRLPGTEANTLDLALTLDSSWQPVRVRVWQDGTDGPVRLRCLTFLQGTGEEVLTHEVRRLLSLDGDGGGFEEIIRRDAPVGARWARYPGVRPLLIPSPYEAAARAIIGHQLPIRQAAAITRRIAAAHGQPLEFEQQTLYAFPPPDRLAGLPEVSGLAARKVEQLRALGRAAVHGQLDRQRLKLLGADAAQTDLQRLSGIGPFSAELVWMRGVGDPDAFPVYEPKLHRVMAEIYGLGEPPDLPTLRQIAERWRPYRAWAGLLLRNL